MELVYLWVKKYKNIQNQGFNFSPRFSCNYDEEKNELTINENENYIPNFFGKNINITAIVGKNGSGKSSILDYIHHSPNDSKTLIIYKYETKYYCTYPNNEPILIGSFKDVNLNILRDSNIGFYPYKDFLSFEKNIGKDNLLSYTYLDGTGVLKSFDLTRTHLYHTSQDSLFIPKYIRVIIEDNQVLNNISSFFKFNALRLILKNNSTKFLSSYIKKEVDSYKYLQSCPLLPDNKVMIYEDNERTNQFLEQFKESRGREKVLYDRNRGKLVELVCDIEELHRSQSSWDDFMQHKQNKASEFELAFLIAFIEFYLKNVDSHVSSEFLYIKLKELKSLIQERIKVLSSKLKMDRVWITQPYILNFIESLNQEIIFNQNSSLKLKDMMESIKYIQSLETKFINNDNPYIDIPIDNNLKTNIKNIAIVQKIFNDEDYVMSEEEKYLRVFELDLVEKYTEATYNTISDGEKQLIRYTVDFLFMLHYNKDEKLILCMADEIDNHLHPIWKKNIISQIILIFTTYMKISKNSTSVQMILTTHSPFLLSDITKGNIIFLDAYKKEDEEVKNGKQNIGNCKVLTHEKVLEKKQTFGANIHTLLSDSFFMEDGLMGEFAKNKIRTIKVAHRYILHRHKRKTLFTQSSKRCRRLLIKQLAKFRQIQEIIGEPFLQKIVKNQLEEMELILLSKNEAIDNEIARLQALKASLR